MSPTPDPGAGAVFVVRDGGAWWRCSVRDRQRTSVDAADVLALVDPPPAAAAVAAAGAVAGEVRPRWIVIGRVDGRRLRVAGPDGLEHLLHADHLRLLDALDGPMDAADLLDRTGATAGAALGDLIAWGIVDGEAAADVSVAGPAGEPRGKSRWLRRRARSTPASPPAGDAGEAAREAGDAARTGAPDPAEPTRPLAEPVRPAGSPSPGGPAGRIPVYSIWHPHAGPLLSLGMLTASLRHHRDGALNEQFEIRRPETAESFLADLATRTGPAVVLASDYVWSLEHNLDAVRTARATHPELVVIHGGPSCPKYEGDAVRFLEDHGDVAHVLTRGEGELLICELFDALSRSGLEIDPGALAGIDGLTFVHPGTGNVVRTPDRPRIVDLDALPSPYLTGEFDHIPIDAWMWCLSIETNRGCPYSCSYCDWGSATLSRIRKFSLERVGAEIDWAARRGVQTINLPDANFGIMSRDVDTARQVAAAHEATGSPTLITFYPAKNTTKHLTKIMDVLTEAGVGTTASLSLQTSDPSTLEAIDRSNISTEHYLALAADYRRRGYPLQGDLLLGLPGQTYASYRNDLQFYFDHEVQARTWQLQILPNAPMNAPEYRERFQIVSDESHRIRSTSTFTEQDRARMLRLRDVDGTCERLGVLRHVLRWLQWEHGIAATRVMDDLIDAIDADPTAWPHLTFVFTWFDVHASGPVGWGPFYAEVRAFLIDRYGVEPSTAFDTVLALNEFLMPAPGRTFPATLALEHDYVEYYRGATRSLEGTGTIGSPSQPLHEYGPATFTIEGDPLGVCTEGLHFFEGTDEGGMEGDFSIGANSANELMSPLLRMLPHVLARGVAPPVVERPVDEPVPTGQRVELTASRAR